MKYLKWLLHGILGCFIGLFFGWLYDLPLVLSSLVFLSSWILLNQLLLQEEKPIKQNSKRKTKTWVQKIKVNDVAHGTHITLTIICFLGVMVSNFVEIYAFMFGALCWLWGYRSK